MPRDYSTKSYVIKDFYKSYCEFVEGNRLYQVSISTFRSVLSDYMKHMMNEVLIKSKEFKMPGRVGSLYVVKKKPPTTRDRLRVDFKATNEMGKTILHLNEHSDGYNFRFFWSKANTIVRYKTTYELVMSRANKRQLASIIKNKQADYIEI